MMKLKPMSDSEIVMAKQAAKEMGRGGMECASISCRIIGTYILRLIADRKRKETWLQTNHYVKICKDLRGYPRIFNSNDEGVLLNWPYDHKPNLAEAISAIEEQDKEEEPSKS